MNDTQPMHYAVVPGDRRVPLEIDPFDPGVFLRACAALDKLVLRRRSTDAPALPASLWRPEIKKKAMHHGNR